MITGLQKSQKMENQTFPDQLDDLQNVGVEVKRKNRHVG